MAKARVIRGNPSVREIPGRRWIKTKFGPDELHIPFSSPGSDIPFYDMLGTVVSGRECVRLENRTERGSIHYCDIVCVGLMNTKPVQKSTTTRSQEIGITLPVTGSSLNLPFGASIKKKVFVPCITYTQLALTEGVPAGDPPALPGDVTLNVRGVDMTYSATEWSIESSSEQQPGYWVNRKTFTTQYALNLGALYA